MLEELTGGNDDESEGEGDGEESSSDL